MGDRLDALLFYQLSLQLWDGFWQDSELMMNDIRGKELVKQMTRSVGSISANIEEGYGRGFGKEYPHFLRISRGSARESKGWYTRAKFFLPSSTIEQRIKMINEIIAMETKAVETLENRNLQKGQVTRDK